MQAPILFPRNGGGIRSNPEGYRGALNAPRPCQLVEVGAHSNSLIFCLKELYPVAPLLLRVRH